MRLKFLFKLATRTFRTRTGRTLLTILGSSIGIAAILVFVSLGYGLQKLTLEQITTSESLLSLDVTTPSEKILIDNEKISEISKLPNVSEISPLASFSGQITFGELTSGAAIYACPPSYFKLSGIVAKEGRVFSDPRQNEIVVSSALLKSFNIDNKQILGKELKISLFKTIDKTGKNEGNDKFLIFDRQNPYIVSGIIDDDTSGFAYVPIETISDMQINTYSQAKVKVTQAKFIDETIGKIVGMGFLVSALSETIDEANKIFGAIQIVLAVFGLVALLVGAIGMANTMTVTLLERTNEIGIMKAIGAFDRDIGIMFLTESIIMGFLSGAGGIIIGFAVSGLLNVIVNLLAKSLGGQSVALFHTPIWFVAFIIVFSTLVGLLSGIFPSRKAAKLNPLEALRYK